MQIAVIGAGLAGVTLARKLQADGHRVTVFEKSRGVGGRMATRQTPNGAFDHGAQYFTVRHPGFRAELQPLLDTGVVVPWEGRVVTLENGVATEEIARDPRYVAVPGMTALCKAWAVGLDIVLNSEFEPFAVRSGFDLILSTAPAAQTLRLFPEAFSGRAALERTTMLGCFTLMATYETPWPYDWQAARPQGGPVGWIAVDASKPGREPGVRVVIQSTNVWAMQHFTDDPAAITATLLMGLPTPVDTVLQRWKYAIVDTPAGEDCLFDPVLGLGAAGDWCIGGRVESAWRSGAALAERVKEFARIGT